MEKSEDDEERKKQNWITDIILVSGGLLGIYSLILIDRLPSDHPLIVILLVPPALAFLVICIAIVIHFNLKNRKKTKN